MRILGSGVGISFGGGGSSIVEMTGREKYEEGGRFVIVVVFGSW